MKSTVARLARSPRVLWRGAAKTEGYDALADRIGALSRFVDATAGYLPEEALTPARGVVARAGERMALSRAHTVVALAGATGSGKSSLFNAFAGAEASPVGLRRPTTGVPHANVWGPADAGDLLDWLHVGERTAHAVDTEADASLSGLVLLDLPDFDSVDSAHRVEADRLLSLVDMIVWVLDPQKYADKVVHHGYLRAFGRHRDITVIALNQADRLDRSDVDRCLFDLRRILAGEGLAGVPTVASSSVGEPGLEELRPLVTWAVERRLALLQRLSADTGVCVDRLAPLMAASEVRPVPAASAQHLSAALANAAGVPVVADAAQRSYVHRAVKHTGWPITRWLRRLRPDPLHRLRLGRTQAAGTEAVVGATNLGPSAAARAGVGLALRDVADQCGQGMPPPWPGVIRDAARSRRADLPDALDASIARADLAASQAPRWWRVIGTVQVALLLVTLVGGLWLGFRYAALALGTSGLPTPYIGRVPWPTFLLVGGLVAGFLLAVAARPVVGAAARRRARRVARNLTVGTNQVGAELVLAPIDRVRTRYDEARKALDAAE